MAHLSEEQIDDLLYCARTNDTQELHATLSQLTGDGAGDGHGEGGHMGDPGEILAAAIDPGSGNSVLHMAAANGHIEILTEMLAILNKSPAPPTVQSLRQQQPAPQTTSSSSQASSQVSSSASKTPSHPKPHRLLNHRNAAGNTALHWSALNGHLATVRALVDAGAALSLHNKAGRTAATEAQSGVDYEIGMEKEEVEAEKEDDMAEGKDEGQEMEVEGKDEAQTKQEEMEKDEGQMRQEEVVRVLLDAAAAKADAKTTAGVERGIGGLDLSAGASSSTAAAATGVMDEKMEGA